jgi:hypothetical protein
MRRWGIVVTVFYAVILIVFLFPAAILLSGVGPSGVGYVVRDMLAALADWMFWVPVAILLAGQILLLCLSVDTSFKKLKPRAHIISTATVAAALTALLAFTAIVSILLAARGEKVLDHVDDKSALWILLGGCGTLWLAWAIVFYLFFRRSSDWVTRATTYLLRGSVLELLVVIPCHVIVRRRHDCCAPVLTAFGIASGIAIMLLSFGPSVLFLYKKRLADYEHRLPTTE